MEKFFKPSIALGSLLGIIFGLLLLIPFIAPLMFFLVFIIAGIIVIVIMKKTNTIGIISLNDGCFIGALSGFSSLITSSIIYMPLVYLRGLLFTPKDFAFNLSKTLYLTGYDLMVIIMLVFFTAVLSAIINAFTGMVTAFIYEKLECSKISFKDHLYMEQFDDTIE